MACGRAVVVTGAGGPAEMIDHGRDGLLVAPEDPAGFAEAVGELLDDASARESLGQAARATVLRRYPAPVIAARMAKRYGTLWEGGG